MAKYKTLSRQEMEQRIQELSEVLEKQLEELLQGEKYMEFLKFYGSFYQYSPRNALLIFAQKPDATLVSSYTSWRAKGRHVRAGEKGIKIIAPMRKKLKDKVLLKDATGEMVVRADGKPERDVQEQERLYFKVSHVFDISQTEGEPIPTLGVNELTGDVYEFEALKKAITAVSPVEVKFKEVEGSAKGYYHRGDKYIAIRAEMPPMQTIKTMIHEVSHATVHNKEYLKAKGKEVKTRAVMETEAEAIAYIVAGALGLDTSEYSIPYLATYASSHTTKELLESLDLIQHTACDLIERIQAERERIQICDREEGKTMDMRVDKVMDLLDARYPDCDVVLTDVTKGNDLHLQGVSIRSPDSPVSPNIYLDDMLKDPRMSAEDIADKVSEMYQMQAERSMVDLITRSVDTQQLIQWDYVRDKVRQRVCDPERNRDYLRDKPVTMFENLAVSYYIDLGTNESGGHMTVSVTDQMLESWGIKLEQLERIALENTREHMTCRSFADVLGIPAPGMEDVRILTNDSGNLGASSILCSPEILKDMQEELGVPIAILPSSVHEALLVPVKEEDDVRRFAEMVSDVNAAVVSQQERLWDGLLLYDQGRIQSIPSPSRERTQEADQDYDMDM